MFAFLDGRGWATRWARGADDRVLEAAVDDIGSDAAQALLDLPWEVLAHEKDFLAADPSQTYVVFRSIGRHPNAAPVEPAYRDLAVMFMAASPRGQRDLD